jgi:hypothetical protein
MKNLDEVFMETFVKTAEELRAPEAAPEAEMTAVEKLAARGGRTGYGKGSAMAAAFGNAKDRFGKMSTKGKVGAGLGAAAATAGAAYGIHKGVKAWKNRKNKK